MSSRVKPDQSTLTSATSLSLPPLALVRLYQQKQGSYFERARCLGASQTHVNRLQTVGTLTLVSNDAYVIGPLPSFAAPAALPGELEIS